MERERATPDASGAAVGLTTIFSAITPDLLDPSGGDAFADCSHTAILVMYAAPQGSGDAEGDRVPLRCGRADVRGGDGWGYRHFVRRWVGVAERFHRDIAAVLARGRRRRLDRIRVRYELAWSDALGGVDRAMTVVVGLRPQQPDLAIRGIVTAYWWDHPERAAHLPTHAVLTALHGGVPAAAPLTGLPLV